MHAHDTDEVKDANGAVLTAADEQRAPLNDAVDWGGMAVENRIGDRLWNIPDLRKQPKSNSQDVGRKAAQSCFPLRQTPD